MGQNIANASNSMRENVAKVQGVVSSALPIFSADLHKRIQAQNSAFTECTLFFVIQGRI